MFINFVKDDKSNALDIEIGLPTGEEELFAELLFGISHGLYLQNIEETLHEQDEDIAQNIIGHYNHLKAMYHKMASEISKNRVVVRPSEFLRSHQGEE